MIETANLNVLNDVSVKIASLSFSDLGYILETVSLISGSAITLDRYFHFYMGTC
jgi:hypothetical protein